MNRVLTMIYAAVGFLLMAGASTSVCAEDNFTQADRERMVRMEASLTVFMQQVDKRFEELRSDMNSRFEQVDKRFEQVDKRFEQVDKRFERVDKRFEQMTDMFYTLSAIFTTLFAAVFGFAWWDRRTMLTGAKKAARKEVKFITEDIGKIMATQRQLNEMLKEFAEKTPDVKELISRAHLL